MYNLLEEKLKNYSINIKIAHTWYPAADCKVSPQFSFSQRGKRGANDTGRR